MATRLTRMLEDRGANASGVGEPRIHWLVTGLLLSSAMWAVLIAVIFLAFGNWAVAAGLTGLALLLLLVLLLALRRARRTDGEG